MGLDYLTLDRLTSTLSGGESQRIQLATSLGSHLVGALYVLDEPSIGLHPRDTQRLIDILKSLRDLGNTVLVVEHDPDTIRAADYVIDLGPGAGELGGKLLFAGTYQAMLEEPKSITGTVSDGRLAHPGSQQSPQAQRKISQGHWRAPAQFAGRGFDTSSRHAHGGHGSQRLREIHAGARRFVQSAGRQAQRLEHQGILRAHRRRRANSRSGDCRPVADRQNAALESRDLSESFRRHSRSFFATRRTPSGAATPRDIFRSTCRAGAARPARATARSPWKCSFSRTSN